VKRGEYTLSQIETDGRDLFLYLLFRVDIYSMTALGYCLFVLIDQLANLLLSRHWSVEIKMGLEIKALMRFFSQNRGIKILNSAR
jgi:hypothetical protein